MRSLKKQGGWIQAAAAIAPIVGSALSGMFGRSSAKRSISFQREMAQNAHQYEVADLRKAGLNPILSGTGGGGARASGGAMPSTPDFASSAAKSLTLAAELRNINAQAELSESKSDLIAPTSSIADDINQGYNYLKENVPSTFKEYRQIYSDYYWAVKEGLKPQIKFLQEQLLKILEKNKSPKKSTNALPITIGRPKHWDEN